MFRRSISIASLVLLASGCGYNRIQSLDERAQQFQGQIEVQLQRRSDLIGNLVETVKGYAAHEQQVFTQVANARSGLANAMRGGDSEEMANANAQLSSAAMRLFAVIEAYPTLKADQNFRMLQDELTGTENRVATARNDYNTAVNDYNGYIRQFPQVVTAKVTGARPRKYFTAAAGTTEAPRVDFSTPKAPPAKTP